MRLTLIHKENLVDNVWAFRFQPSLPLDWIAGQFIRVELKHEQPDKEGTKRWFTVSSPPYEKVIQITTRITDSSFKQALAKLAEGDELQLLEKPDGDFIWENSHLPIIFIAGGIGVTPFYSILKQRVHEKLPLGATLIYGSRTKDLPFKEEFDHWAMYSPPFMVQYVVGTPLTAESLAKMRPGINASLVYLSGPEPMVETLGDELKDHGMPDKQLKQDFFPNYTKDNY